ncbi:tRNA lysidine(34) synthetase TilS [Pseudomonas turukhanskensis]|uniref:tRNA(Ile)-lysidine synthase n=1 Tax=Pseudomonas turukhanskensis TaxID=1806536 RepID=A0A9W6K6Q3_9PSED|nr:tRNA lysidine(34) synthetase TilS [Pseudomonas turukhanskensis]GLK87953.1 tRNA(Ile)-lysidine synthase [Pseudomonas turukhanskensis]
MSLHARLLAGLAPWRAAPAWHIALSGGLDSTVLLHLLASLGHTEHLPPLHAIHIHHGLQAAADGWPAHCQRLCDGLGVPLQIISVQVAPVASVERAAREARYQAFTQVVGEGEVLLTAQHRDDQAETLLFRLLRGAGVRGLAGIPASRPLGRGMVIRPLLECSREQLLAYAVEHGLSWVEDPTNADPSYARNHLRHQVFPQFAAHWPQAAQTLARSAAHLREAQGLLDDLAALDLAPAQSQSPFSWLRLPSLALQPLLDLSPERQRNALRHWLAPLTLLPDSEHWAGWTDLRDAASDAKPIWRLAQGELHREGGRLWWLSGDWLRAPRQPPSWLETTEALHLAANGQLRFQGEAPQGPLQVRYRQGGEVLNIPGRGHRDLKRLLNEHAIPAFVRARLPLLFRDDELLAVANLPAIRGPAEVHWQLQWQAPTNDQRLS